MTDEAPGTPRADEEQPQGGHAADRLREQLIRDLGAVPSGRAPGSIDEAGADPLAPATDGEDNSNREGSP